MSKQKVLIVESTEIRFYAEHDDDFFSLTDMAKRSSDRPEIIIQNWLRGRSTIEFLGLWEQLHNTHFNHIEFDVIKNQTGVNSFGMSVGDWASRTGAIGIRAKSGRYGGTFAHRDIAFEFGSWLSPSFKLLVIKEFQRLKTAEAAALQTGQDWSLKRTLAKVNYVIHSDAVREQLVPPLIQNTRHEAIVHASEADLLNLAMFGITAKEWRAANPDLRGNLRDHASNEQLLVLANLENLNAEFIRQGLSKDLRLQRLNEIAVHQMRLLLGTTTIQRLASGE